MDQNIVFILNWVKDVLANFGTTALLAVVGVSLIGLFLNRKK